MNPIHNLFDTNELFKLKRIGIELERENVKIFQLGRKQRQKLISTLKTGSIDKLVIQKTNLKDYSFLSIFNILNSARLFFESNESAERIYYLIVHTKKKQVIRTEIKNFDLITTTRIIKRLNEALENQVE